MRFNKEYMSARQIRKCSYVRFPRHPHKQMHACSNEPLLKYVKTTTGKKLFVPYKIYAYKRLIDSIRELYYIIVWLQLRYDQEINKYVHDTLAIID